MNDKITNIGSVIGKEILNLSDGSFLGKVQGVFIDETEQKLTGLKVKQKGLLGGKNSIPFESIKSFGTHKITIENLKEIEVEEGRNIISMPIVTSDGTILGKIIDFAFEPVDGKIVEYVLKGGLMESTFEDYGTVSGESIIAIGKDAIIAKEDLAEEDFKKPDEEVYGDWKVVDEVIDGLDDDDDDDEETISETTDSTRKENNFEDQFDEITNKITKTIGDVTDKIKKEVTSDDLGDKLKEQADKIGEEAKSFLTIMKDKLQQNKPSNLDPDLLKQDLKNKMGVKTNKKDDNEDALASQIVEQLKGASVEKPLLDGQGNVIVWPGQLIGNEEVKQAIKAGKLQELISLTVQLTMEEEGLEAEQADPRDE